MKQNCITYSINPCAASGFLETSAAGVAVLGSSSVTAGTVTVEMGTSSGVSETCMFANSLSNSLCAAGISEMFACPGPPSAFLSSCSTAIFSSAFAPTSLAALVTLLKAPVTHAAPVRTYLFFMIADPAVETLCSAAASADFVFSETWYF
uniref:Uncharacterized protein n=1 Tax=Zea mays TaxID=4577 RepID=C0PAB8_MAIZE|nr:unknown [Zea mays]